MSGWTRRFAVASALSMVAFQALVVLGVGRRATAVVGLFGAVLPMTFGMAYLLLPSYVGRTLSTPRLQGIHFAVAYAGTGLLVGHELLGIGRRLAVAGAVLWSVGVAIFVGTILWTVRPAVPTRPADVLDPDSRPRRTPRLVAAALPVAVGYLVVGTVVLLATVTGVRTPVGATLPAVVHYYAAGFAALLIFALGLRLLPGFFHVTPPASVSWLVLLCGCVAPGVLAARLWRPPWFLVGAGLEAVAMAGYAVVVAVVAYRTDRHRPGLYGVGLGALGGVAGVIVAAVGAFGVGPATAVAVHVPLVLGGFLLPTIVGYAYQFFPVTTGRFQGATLLTIASLGVGVVLWAVGAGPGTPWLRTLGGGFGLVGTGGYAYLLAGRLLG